MISKSLSTSEARAALHRVVPNLAEFCHALYPLLIAHSDDFGRLQGDSFTVKHAIEPTSPRLLQDFEAGLQAMDEVDLIQWYGTNGRKFIQIQDFEEHQTGLHKRTKSAFPDPPRAVSRKSPESPSEEKRTELKGREEKKDVCPEPLRDSAPEATSPVFLEFPITGADGPTWRLREVQVLEWEALFDTLDVRQSARQALAWVKANMGRRKTKRGMPGFLTGWFGRDIKDGKNLKSGRRPDDGRQTRPRGAWSPQPRAPWVCPHVEHCNGQAGCRIAINLKRPERPGVVYELDEHSIPRSVEAS